MFTSTHNGATARVNVLRPADGVSRRHLKMQVLDLLVELLIARSRLAEYWPAGFKDVRSLLAAIPLPTVDYAAACRHVQNAVQYAELHEFGAAAFELRALRGQLQKL
jgi:hypothetical protein